MRMKLLVVLVAAAFSAPVSAQPVVRVSCQEKDRVDLVNRLTPTLEIAIRLLAGRDGLYPKGALRSFFTRADPRTPAGATIACAEFKAVRRLAERPPLVVLGDGTVSKDAFHRVDRDSLLDSFREQFPDVSFE